MTLRTAGGLLTLCALISAAPALAQRRPVAPNLGGRQITPQVQPVQQPPRGAAGTPAPQATPQTQQQVDKQRATCEQVRRKARFNVYFDKVEIEKLVQTVADATCKTFILPENIRGKISIIGPEMGRVEVTADEFYRAFLAALDANSLAVYQQGDFLKVVDKRNAKQTPIPTVLDPDAPYTTAEQMVTKIFKVKYVEVEPLRGVLQQLVSQNGDTIPFPPDTIIINDLGSNMHRLQRIIEQLDSRSSSESLRVVQINYATAQEIADKIQALFPPQQAQARPGQRGGQPRAAVTTPPPPPGGTPALAEGAAAAGQEGAGATAGPVTVSQIIPDERTNKLIIVASPAGFERAEDIIRLLDVPIPGEGRINVYYLENADAEEMANTLSSLAQGTGGTAPGRPGRPTPQARGPQQTQPAGAQSAELFGGEVKISADAATNALVIVANQSDYRNLVRVIERLDMPRRQVFVEAVIMEVNIDRNLGYGARVHTGAGVPNPVPGSQPSRLPVILGTKFGNEQLPPSLTLGGLTQFGGFLAGLQGPVIPGTNLLGGLQLPAFGVLLHALQESSDVNVLSTPHILTMDNEEAEITVGQNVPFQAGVVSGLSSLSGLAGAGNLLGGQAGATGINPALGLSALGGLGSVVAPINRQNVELKLTVKPQINESDYIRLEINESTEEIASQDPVLGPTTSRRTAKTTVVARDQETVVIGGIMQDRTIEGVTKTPILGDIPLIGYLFREQTQRKVKTNLLLFLTPYIIKDQSDFRRIFERKMKERQEFVEMFYGQVPGYQAAVDFGRKSGPLAEIDAGLRRELQKVQNGGPGVAGERVILPGAAPTRVGPSAPAAGEGEAGGEQPTEGGEVEPGVEGAVPQPEQPGVEGFSPPEGSGETPPPSEEIQVQ